MNPIAAEAIAWTQPKLDAAQREFLNQLPLTFEDGSRLFVHASAHAPGRWEYITSVESASRSFMATRAQSTFCGHVHVPQLYHMSPAGEPAGFRPVQSVEIPLLPHRRWLAVIRLGRGRSSHRLACVPLVLQALLFFSRMVNDARRRINTPVMSGPCPLFRRIPSSSPMSRRRPILTSARTAARPT